MLGVSYKALTLCNNQDPFGSVVAKKMISQGMILGSENYGEELELFPIVVRRGFERAWETQREFKDAIEDSNMVIPKGSCICINGSVSRLESVLDSDIDYVLIWDDLIKHSSSRPSELSNQSSSQVVDRINSAMAKRRLRPCDSFSCHRPLSELLSTENLFSRYCVLTLVDSTFIAGDLESYNKFIEKIKLRLGGYAIGISADQQVIRALVWYIQREGWIDQLNFGTSVNRFSRLIQLFTTIMSINQFGIDSTRGTKTTWLRLERLESHLPRDETECLKKLWLGALELKENRTKKPMLGDSKFIGISKLLEIWKGILVLSQTPFA